MFCFRAAALFLLFSITLGSYAPYYDLADAEQHFANFINKFEKKYESVGEFRRRFDIFKRHLNKLNEWNAQYKHENGGYVITQFSDQDGRRSDVDLSQMSNTTRKHEVKIEYILNAPAQVDYRNQRLVSGVRDQGNCGCSYIFSAIGNIEGVAAKQTRPLWFLAEQQILDCTNATCDGGMPVNVMNDMARSHGIMDNLDYNNPYTGEKQTCALDPNDVKVKVTGGHEINTPDVETIKGALVENGAPLSVLFFASPSVRSYSGSDVLNPTDCGGNQPDHAVLLVGYNADPASGKRPHWIIKNSWGTGVGDQGYFYIDFENKCSFGTVGTATSSVA